MSSFRQVVTAEMNPAARLAFLEGADLILRDE
jgi:hypothetical protein